MMTQPSNDAQSGLSPEPTAAERAARLVAEMTLEEKVSQMVHESVAIERLGIPAYNWWNECLHGVARAGIATVFPQAIGLAATFDLGLMHRVATAISDEARAKHHDFVRRGMRVLSGGLTFWSPNINIFRDPRWGRGQETYGEDPFLSARMGVTFVKGLQGDDGSEQSGEHLKLIATPKHFAVHSGPESIRHRFDAVVSERDLRETYLPAFEACVREGPAGSIMGGYNRTNGEACCASPTLLQQILRDEWGFDGYVVSDCWAIGDIFRHHRLVDTIEEAASLAVRAGCDLNCGEAYLALLLAQRRGLISEADIDQAVERLMTARLRLGTLDPPESDPYASIPIDVVSSPAHVALAREAAVKSVVLLKNDGLLPLRRRIRSIAVIGPLADDEDALLGNYNGTPAHAVTVLEAIRTGAGKTVDVRYSRGCRLADGWPNLSPVPSEALSTIGEDRARHPGLRGVYFPNAGLAGTGALDQVDPRVSFVWRGERPLPYLDGRPFSVRWTGVLTPPLTGKYRLGFRGSQRFSVWLDGRLILQGDNVYSPELSVADIELQAGRPYDLRIDFVSGVHHAHAQLVWATPGQTQVEREQALAIAADADLIVACMGLSPAIEGEEMPVTASGFAGGDRTRIELPQPQLELLKLLYGLHKPVVLVLMTGSAIAIPWSAEKLPAILVGWYGGEQGGNAVADVIFGDANPAGRLPVTFYRSTDDLPPFEDYAMTGRTYRFFQGWPLYPFGHGLSYTTFEYSNLEVTPGTIGPEGEAVVHVDITNAGKVAGDEVVQLYVRYPNSAVPRAREELKGFERIHLAPGETQTVRFAVSARQLAYWDDGWQVETDAVHLAVGASSEDIRLSATLNINGDIIP